MVPAALAFAMGKYGVPAFLFVSFVALLLSA